MIGKSIHNYQIESLLGEGGMGKVYLAKDKLLGRLVAIKSLNPNLTSQPQFLERFKNEAQILAKLSHPNIALLYNYLQEDNNYFMVMEYVEGQNLDEVLRKKGKLSYLMVVPIVCAILEGLDHAHKKGILHRDIKPANIMLSKSNCIKLMDFGIAKVSDAAKLTQVSRVIGTVAFLAPEIIEGKEPSIASDIYALGITMYELLCGKLPFTGKSDYMLMQDIVKEKPVMPHELDKAIPVKLSNIVLKALEKKPEKRFLNAKEFLQAIQIVFPDLKEIDEKDIVHTIPATTLMMKNDEMIPKATTVSKDYLATRVDNKKSNATAKTFDAMSLLRNKLLYLVLILFLVIFALFKLFSNNNTDDQSNEIPAVNNQVNNNASNENDLNQLPPAQNTDSIAMILNEKKEGEGNSNSTQKMEEKNNETEQQNDKSKKISTDEKNVKPKQEKEKKEEEKIPEPRNINESVKLRVDALLSLRNSITREEAYNGQSVSFKVLESVNLKGKTIIPAGSIIYGNIEKIGKIRMDLQFNSVSIHGRSHRLERSGSSANIKAVFSSNSFKVGLRGVLYP